MNEKPLSANVGAFQLPGLVVRRTPGPNLTTRPPYVPSCPYPSEQSLTERNHQLTHEN